MFWSSSAQDFTRQCHDFLKVCNTPVTIFTTNFGPKITNVSKVRDEDQVHTSRPHAAMDLWTWWRPASRLMLLIYYCCNINRASYWPDHHIYVIPEQMPAFPQIYPKLISMQAAKLLPSSNCCNSQIDTSSILAWSYTPMFKSDFVKTNTFFIILSPLV